jgi:hypothetical protein
MLWNSPNHALLPPSGFVRCHRYNDCDLQQAEVPHNLNYRPLGGTQVSEMRADAPNDLDCLDYQGSSCLICCDVLALCGGRRLHQEHHWDERQGEHG